MSPQPGTSRLSVGLAAFFMVAALGAFGAAFYLYDGTAVVSELLASRPEATASASAPTSSSADAAKLTLPAGMPEEFALRLWQEQLDSQEMITRLVSGEVASLRVDRITKKDDEAQLFVTVRFVDAPQLSGAVGLRRFGEDWYIAGVSALREGQPTEPTSELPGLGEVDVALINTMIAENLKSQDVISEYLDGTVRQVIVEDIVSGPQTATMQIEMDESHGEGYANLVAIEEEIDGSPSWFLARFTKTGHNPPE